MSHRSIGFFVRFRRPINGNHQLTDCQEFMLSGLLWFARALLRCKYYYFIWLMIKKREKRVKQLHAHHCTPTGSDSYLYILVKALFPLLLSPSLSYTLSTIYYIILLLSSCLVYYPVPFLSLFLTFSRFFLFFFCRISSSTWLFPRGLIICLIIIPRVVGFITSIIKIQHMQT